MKQGEILFGKYRVERKLGSGGMSDVFLAVNLQLGNKWAVKHIKNDDIALTEIDILKKLNHRSLPQIADIFRDDGGTYIIESYIEGISLQRMLEQGREISAAAALDWSIQLCEVLSYLHNLKPYPVIYRDIKPLNIMVTKGGRIVLVDFGISKLFKKSGGRDEHIAGTNAYAAPEQMVYEGHSDRRSDIYSLGAVMRQLFQAAAGAEKERPKNKSRLHMYSIIRRCMEKSPDNRFQCMEELAQELDRLAEEISYEQARDKLAFKLLLLLSAVLSIATYGLAAYGLLC